MPKIRETKEIRIHLNKAKQLLGAFEADRVEEDVFVFRMQDEIRWIKVYINLLAIQRAKK